MDPLTIDTYNKMAGTYDDETVDFWDRFPRDFITRFADLVKEARTNTDSTTTPRLTHPTILDIGSGPGRDALLLQDLHLDVTCLDASTAMIERCQAKGLTSILGDFMHLPFDPNTFDGIWAYTSLLHVKKADIGVALKEIHRVLKPDGIFGLGLIEGTEELHRPSSEMQLMRWFSFYTKEEIESLLAAHGFIILHFDTIKPGSRHYLHFIARKK